MNSLCHDDSGCILPPDGDKSGGDGEANILLQSSIIRVMEKQQEEFLSLFKDWQKRQQDRILEAAKVDPCCQHVGGDLESDRPSGAHSTSICWPRAFDIDTAQQCHSSSFAKQDERRRSAINSDILSAWTRSSIASKRGLGISALHGSIKDDLDGRNPDSRWSCAISKVSVEAIVQHPMFEWCIACLILANTFTIAYASEYAMQNLHNQQNSKVAMTESVFCAAYTLEMALRLSATGFKKFICVRGTGWNRFDMGLVLISWYGQAAALFDVSGSNISFIRLLRLLKMLRILRMIRLMRAFHELRLILASIMGCANVLFWAGILIFLVAFMFGLCFLMACTSYLADGHVKYADRIDKHWGSLSTSVLGLYMAATGGESWANMAEPLWEVGAIYYILFLFYILFVEFVIVNTLTSLFVEATIENSHKDTQYIIHNELKKKEHFMDKLNDFYHNIDSDGDGEITYHEFVSSMDSPEMFAFAQCLEIDTTDLDRCFNVLSGGGKRPVDLEAFVVGCIRLKGVASSADLTDLMYQHARAAYELKKLGEHTQQRIVKLEEELTRILSPREHFELLSNNSATKNTVLSDEVRALGIVASRPVPTEASI